jgi:DNA polymerase-1
MNLLLIDGHYIGYQAKHTMGSALSFGGAGTGVIYGFLRRVIDLSRSLNARCVYTLWDDRPTARQALFPGYKAKRHSQMTPEEMVEMEETWRQFDILRDNILPRIGIPVYWSKGLEADDLIAALVSDNGYLPASYKFFIISSDHDLYQLLTFPQVTIGSFPVPRKGKPYEEKYMDGELFQAEFGIHPSEWVKVKSIAGCPGDEVPGVPGVGEKTAIKFLRGLLKPDSKAMRSIQENAPIIVRNRALVELPFPTTPPQPIKPFKLDLEELRKVCVEFNMLSLLEERQWVHWNSLQAGRWPTVGAGTQALSQRRTLNCLS